MPSSEATIESPPAPLPPPDVETSVAHDGATIAYATYGAGSPVVLLHGAMGSSEDWGNQLPALVHGGHRVIAIDSRGHGKSTRDARPFDYETMARDVVAVLDDLSLPAATVVGWSDGAIVAMVLAMKHARRVTRVFAFGGNMDRSGLKAVTGSEPILQRAIARLQAAYIRRSPTPDAFAALSTAVNQMMDTQPNYTEADLATIRVPLAIAFGESDEFIERAYSEKLASQIPNAELVLLPGVTHFAPLQDPARFNAAMLQFVDRAT